MARTPSIFISMRCNAVSNWVEVPVIDVDEEPEEEEPQPGVRRTSCHGDLDQRENERSERREREEGDQFGVRSGH